MASAGANPITPMPINVPAKTSAASLGDNQEMEKAVTLSVNEKGDVFWNKEKITLAEHEEIIGRIAGHDPKAAEEAMTKHLERSRALYALSAAANS